MPEHTMKQTDNPWRWFRNDPGLARAMHAVLVSGEGGDIIAAMRGMTPQSVFETVAIAFGDLCEESERAYRTARQRADQWARWQLMLGISTVCVIVVSIILTLISLPMAAAGSGAVSFVTGSAVMWFDRKVDENRREAEERFQDMARYCTHNKLILQLMGTLGGLDPEQQEKLVSAVLGLRI